VRGRVLWPNRAEATAALLSAALFAIAFPPFALIVPAFVCLVPIAIATVRHADEGGTAQGAARTWFWFGLIGYGAHRLGCEPAPFLMGFVLGGPLEEHFRRAMVFSDGNPLVFLTQPISAGLLLAACLVLVMVMLPAITRRRDEIFADEA